MKKKQNFSNHIRYYTPHHLIFYPLIGLLVTLSVRYIYKDPGNDMVWKMITAVILVTGWLSYMMRQHYSLTLQNRIVRLEMRVRYFELTGKRLEAAERELSFNQIAALRFAPDDEMPALMQKAITEKLSASDIKKSIINWMPDHMRV